MSQLAKKTMRMGLACLLAVSATAVSAAQQASVEISMKAEKEIIVVDDNGKKAAKRIGVAVLDERGYKSTSLIAAAVTPGDGRTRHAQPEDYTHVRWTLAEPLSPGQQGQLSYRAVLE